MTQRLLETNLRPTPFSLYYISHSPNNFTRTDLRHGLYHLAADRYVCQEASKPDLPAPRCAAPHRRGLNS
jgi:hypothetical protein